MLPSALFVSVAEENVGCDGGIVTGAHDEAATHCSWITGGPDCVGGSEAVGAVGDFELEHPIANTNKSPQNVRVTNPPPIAGDRDTRTNYSDVVPLNGVKMCVRAWLNLGIDAADVAFCP